MSNGTMHGAAVEYAGSHQRVQANAVLLASGGFARSTELMAKYAPNMQRAAKICGIGSDGDGLLMGEAVGAALRDMNFVSASYGFVRTPARISDMTLIYYAGGIIRKTLR